jgi:hypothetical protein
MQTRSATRIEITRNELAENVEMCELDLALVAAGLNKGGTSLAGLDRENDPNFVRQREQIQQRLGLRPTYLK